MLHLSNFLENNVLVGPPQCFIFVIICHLRGNYASLQEITEIVALEVQLNAEVDKNIKLEQYTQAPRKFTLPQYMRGGMMKIVSPWFTMLSRTICRGIDTSEIKFHAVYRVGRRRQKSNLITHR